MLCRLEKSELEVEYSEFQYIIKIMQYASSSEGVKLSEKLAGKLTQAILTFDGKISMGNLFIIVTSFQHSGIPLQSLLSKFLNT